MTINLSRTLRQAWALFRSDRDLLLGVAGALIFLPVFALQLLVPGPPAMPASGAAEADTLAWAQAATAWAGANGGWYLLAYALIYWGQATIFTLYLDPARRDVGAALRRAAPLVPRYLLAMLLVSIPTAFGLMLFILPGLYVMGRTMLTGPALVAERPIGAARAIVRALSLSRGNGLPLMGLAALSVLAKWAGASPFLTLDTWMRGGGATNPLAIALVDAGAALTIAAAELGLALAAVVAYRRLTSSGT